MTRLCGFAALALATSYSSLASAQDPARVPSDFGAKGQISLNVDLPFTNDAPQLGIVHSSQDMGGGSSTTVTIAPALDYFVAPNVSVGAKIGYQHTSSSAQGSNVSAITSGFVFAVRGGFNVPLGPTLSLWPRLSLGYQSQTIGDFTYSVVPLAIFAPLLWHPTSHFFIGCGPVFITDLSSKAESMGFSVDGAKQTDIGLQAIVGGYFGT